MKSHIPLLTEGDYVFRSTDIQKHMAKPFGNRYCVFKETGCRKTLLKVHPSHVRSFFVKVTRNFCAVAFSSLS